MEGQISPGHMLFGRMSKSFRSKKFSSQKLSKKGVNKILEQHFFGPLENFQVKQTLGRKNMGEPF